MLSPEQIVFLKWLNDQPEPMSKKNMHTLQAPCYTDARVEAMHRDELLTRTLSVEDGQLVTGYSPSDKAKTILWSQEQRAKELADEKENIAREKKRDRLHDFLCVLVGYLLGLLTDFLQQLFQHLWP